MLTFKISAQSKPFKSFAIFTLIITIVLNCLITSTLSLEFQKNIDARQKQAAQLQKISNNKMSYGYNKEFGFFCKSLQYIKAQEHLYDIPKSLTISPYYLFPFKFELMDILLEVPDIKSTLGKDQNLATYLLTFQYLIYKNAPKNTLKKFIIENGYTDYENCFEPDPSIFNSIPDFVPNIYNYQDEDLQTLIRLKLNFTKLREMLQVYEAVVVKLRQSKWGSELYYAFNDVQVYKETYAIIMSRTMTVNLPEFFKLEGYTEFDPKLTTLQKKNIQKNKVIGMPNGAPVLLAYVDLCNHKQPSSFNEKGKNFIHINSRKDFYFHHSSNNWRPGNEITFNYSNTPYNLILSVNYGFVVKNNIFDEQEITIKDNYTFNLQQINLCKEIGCFGESIKTPNQIKKERKDVINNNQFNSNLMNYGRVRALKGKIENNSNNLYKKYMKYGYFSKSNEISAYLFYFNVVKDELRGESANIYESIFEGTNMKKKAKELEETIKEKDYALINKWKRYAVMSNVYDTSFLIRNILIVHTNKIIDKVIETNYDSIENLKEKYLSKFN